MIEIALSMQPQLFARLDWAAITLRRRYGELTRTHKHKTQLINGENQILEEHDACMIEFWIK
jgi:hypothetical protein